MARTAKRYRAVLATNKKCVWNPIPEKKMKDMLNAQPTLPWHQSTRMTGGSVQARNGRAAARNAESEENEHELKASLEGAVHRA